MNDEIELLRNRLEKVIAVKESLIDCEATEKVSLYSSRKIRRYNK